MSNQDNQDDMDDGFDEVINPEDVVQVIELDDPGDDVAGGIDVIDISDEDGEGMEASGRDVKDMADLVFTKHTDSVFCVHIDLVTCDLAVTGGQDDMAFVWRLSTGEVVLECKGHKESVTCTGFSYDGVYVATADLSGLVKVWKLETKQEVFTFECSDAEWLRWHPAAHVLFLGTVDGEVWVWKIPSGEYKTLQGPGCMATCGAILPDGKRACVGYDDGTVRTWDVKSGTMQHGLTGSAAHQATVTCIDAHPDNSLVITGSTDVTAKLFNSSSGKVLSVFDCDTSKKESGDNSVETVGFSHTHQYVATGTVTGTLSIWDMNTQNCRLQTENSAGFVSLRWDKLSPLIYTSSLDGVVQLWDARSGQVTSSWTGHTDALLGFDISRDGSSLVSVSEDNTARVFNLAAPDR